MEVDIHNNTKKRRRGKKSSIVLVLFSTPGMREEVEDGCGLGYFSYLSGELQSNAKHILPRRPPGTSSSYNGNILYAVSS